MSQLHEGVEKASSVHLQEVPQERQGTGFWREMAMGFEWPLIRSSKKPTRRVRRRKTLGSIVLA